MSYMKTQDLIDRLVKSGKSVFTIEEVAMLSGKKEAYLSRLLPTNRKIIRIERGKYFIEGTDILQIASNIVYPSYLSLMSAFRYYDLTTQEPVLINVIALKAHKPVIVRNMKIKFTKTMKTRFFGYRKERNNIFIAYPEKAIVDALYFMNPEFSAIDEAVGKALDENLIDIKKIKEFALKMGSKTLINKLGFVLENHNIACQDLLNHISKHYVILSMRGAKNTRWRLVI